MAIEPTLIRISGCPGPFMESVVGHYSPTDLGWSGLAMPIGAITDSPVLDVAGFNSFMLLLFFTAVVTIEIDVFVRRPTDEFSLQSLIIAPAPANSYLETFGAFSAIVLVSGWVWWAISISIRNDTGVPITLSAGHLFAGRR